MNKLIKLLIIALACPLILPIVIDDEVTEEDIELADTVIEAEGETDA